ncbi:DnaD domain protein [Paenibacillaceae bacterium WGS1546]|uniref:DnaD domain protein n=1 Tax=Cohnella sp. WGS1546 TaxID=3366810 RepID=UPI00372D43B8
MRVSNLMEYTESHRFVASRYFSLSALDRKVFASLYQPMVGAVSASFYQLLYHQLPEDGAGFCLPEPQRKLFLGLGLEPNAAGRQTAIDAASRLEAVGLMQVYRNYHPLTDECLYEYALQPPLGPAEFFSNDHLTLLLGDKVGKSALLELREAFSAGRPAELARFVNREEATAHFADIFRISPAAADPDLTDGWTESAVSRERPAFQPAERIRHADMLLRFPRGSANRGFVERLHRAPESMAQINYLAYKYDLEVPEVCRLLDEDGIFRADGTLLWDELQYRANLLYRQDRKRDEERERLLARAEERRTERGEPAEPPLSPALRLAIPERFQEEVTVARYNEMLCVEPYTRMLARFFPGEVPDQFARAFERIDLNYKLPEPVINVLIHYVFSLGRSQRITRSFVEAIASNMLAKGIDSLEKAVLYVQEQEKLNEELERKRKGEEPARGAASGYGGQGKRNVRKPAMSVVKDTGPAEEVTPEQLERMLARARELKGKK